MSDELRRRVLELYAEVDAAVAAAGPVCVASGRCCRFKEYGHTLFVSNLEADVLLAAAPPYVKPVSSDFCPFQKGNLCTAREPRPLGCRIYYCDPNYQTAGQRLSGACQSARWADDEGPAHPARFRQPWGVGHPCKPGCP